MPLWDVDFSDIDEDTEIPIGVGEEDKLPEGYSEEFEAIDVFVTENLLRAKESKDVAMVKFVVEQAITRYSKLGLKQAALDKEIWLTQQLGKGIVKGFQTKKRSEKLQTQIQYMEELISDQKQKEVELRSRVANLRAERDFKKAKLEAVLRQNQGTISEIDHIKKRIALTQERLRLDTIEYEKEKELRDDLMKTFTEYTEDLDRQLENAPWLMEKQKEAARRKELEDEITRLEADMAKIDVIEQRNKEIEECERELPFQQFCVQMAVLYLKREKMAMQLEAEKEKVKRLEQEKRQRRAMEETSQLDSTQVMLDADLDDEETLLRMAKHYKLDTQNLHPPISQMTQDSQLLPPSQPPTRKRAESTTDSTASSEANDMDMSDVGVEQQEIETKIAPPAAKRVSIVLPTPNPDESVDEAIDVHKMKEKEALNESQMDEDEYNGDRSQPEQMEVEEREEEEEEERRDDDGSQEREKDGEEEENEQMDQQVYQPGSQESEIGSMAGGQMEQEVEEEEVNSEVFTRPAEHPIKLAPETQENEEEGEHLEEAETSFNPEMMLNLSMNSNDPGNDFFDMMNNQATRKRTAADAAGGSPVVGGSDGGDGGGFMNMFGGGPSGGEGAAADGDGASFSFNFGGGDANETSGGGGEFNFFGF